MKRKYGIMLSMGLVITGAIIFFLSIERPAWVILDGEVFILQTRAFSTEGVLKAAGITLGDYDAVNPGLKSWVGWKAIIQVDTSNTVQLWLPGMTSPAYITSRERTPGNLMTQFGVKLYPGDRLLWNGEAIQPDKKLPKSDNYLLQYISARRLIVQEDGQERVIYSAAPTLAEALWQNDVQLRVGDQVSMPLTLHPEADMRISIQHAVPILVHTASGAIQSLAPAATTGQALAAAGLSLQGLDYSIPPEDTPLTVSNDITLKRVSEEFILDEQIIPFSSEYIADAETTLDQTRVISSGHYGLQVSRLRIRYEDGTVVSQTNEAEWTASQPQNEQIGYGTRVDINTLSTPDGTIEYWRAVNVYATSYSPCNLGTGSCNNVTASGAPLQQGIIAVSSAWYSWMKGQRVYVPGYGYATIADLGGGIPGQYWIDLGYTDDTYVSWHHNVMLYFLTPVPASIPYTLP